MKDMELRKQWVAEDAASLADYLADYQFDDAYTPNKIERLILEDALNGWESEQNEVWCRRIAALRQPTQSDVSFRELAAVLYRKSAEFQVGLTVEDSYTLAAEAVAFLQEQSK